MHRRYSCLTLALLALLLIGLYWFPTHGASGCSKGEVIEGGAAFDECCPQAQEYDGTPADANDLGTLSGFLCATGAIQGHVDYFRFALDQACQVTITTTSPDNGDTTLSLYGEPNPGVSLAFNDDAAAGVLESRIVEQLAAGIYYVAVRGFDPKADMFRYTLKIQGSGCLSGPIVSPLCNQPCTVPAPGAACPANTTFYDRSILDYEDPHLACNGRFYIDGCVAADPQSGGTTYTWTVSNCHAGSSYSEQGRMTSFFVPHNGVQETSVVTPSGWTFSRDDTHWIWCITSPPAASSHYLTDAAVPPGDLTQFAVTFDTPTIVDSVLSGVSLYSFDMGGCWSHIGVLTIGPLPAGSSP